MAGVATKKPLAPVVQVLVMRRDLQLKQRDALRYASQASLAFIARRAGGGNPLALSDDELTWLRLLQTQLHLRVHSEAALRDIARRARRAGLSAHLLTQAQLEGAGASATAVCCAIGPAPPAAVRAITGRLPLW